MVRSNWRDNPWVPTPCLEGERQLDLEKYPDRYSHVWLGDYARAFEVPTRLTKVTGEN